MLFLYFPYISVIVITERFSNIDKCGVVFIIVHSVIVLFGVLCCSLSAHNKLSRRSSFPLLCNFVHYIDIANVYIGIF